MKIPIGVAKIVFLAFTALAAGAFGPWTSNLGRDNPLVGKIYGGEGRIDENALAEQLANAPIVLLGEVHDNPDHHRLQARFVRAIARSGRRPALVLEMLPRSEQDRLDGFLAKPQPKSSDFAKTFEWEQRGWPDFAIYKPIIDAALEFGLPIVAGNIDNTLTRKIAREGFAALEKAKAWRLGENFPEPLANQLDQALMKGHCNLLPETALPAMRKVQRARDASMADALIGAHKPDGAILIAGSGHVRSDYGVPYHLNKRGMGDKWLAVRFVPVGDAQTDAKKYLAAHGPANDKTVTIFTPRIDDKDHCAEMRAHMSKPKKAD